MKIVFDDKAISDLQAIREWIAQDSPDRATKVLERIRRAISVLDRFPERGRRGRHPETHELIVPKLPYLVVYQIRKDVGQIIIVSVLHMARDRSMMGR
jgi:addiction module RelE/StbE family toxin